MRTVTSPISPCDMLALLNMSRQPVSIVTDHPSCIPLADPRRAQLLAMFDKCDERAKELLLRLGAIHAREYPGANS